MTRRQLRAFYPPGELARVYAKSYDHTRWSEHILRVGYTASLLRGMEPSSVADLSCGDGAVVSVAGLSCPAYLGDMSPGWEFCGPIEQTITQVPEVDVFVCSETLEHVEDPDALLQAIRGKASRLLLTTPAGEDDARNWEHYWGWDVGDLDSMLALAGWPVRAAERYTPPVEQPYYTFQAWRCSSG